MSTQENRITITSSSTADQQKNSALAQTPQDRIKETVQLILRVFGKPASEKSTRIIIDKA